MISARDFCRIPELPISIFFTYTFDPLFFERVPWNDLAIGGRRRVVIAADFERVAEAMIRCGGQIAYLGRSYLLAETSYAGVFHPKLIARLSEQGGRVWVGSGNLTYTGWGGNRELATSWAVGPAEEDNGGWLNDVLERACRSIGSTAFADQLRDIRTEIPWLTRSKAAQNAPILMGSDERPLAPQLLERWRGRRFDHVRICTGSTDVNGAFLGWAKQAFGVRRATLYLNIANASFDPQRLEDLDMDIQIIPAPPEQMLHAKFYWFDGDDGAAAVMGSANCSAAAWLANNIELIVPYDDPSEREFETVLSVFDGDAHRASDVLKYNPTEKEDDAAVHASHRLVSLRLRPSNLIEAVIDPPLSEDAVAYIVFLEKAGEQHELARRKNEWAVRMPDSFQIGSMALFASVEGKTAGVSFRTAPRWVDNDELLDRVAGRFDVDISLAALSRERFRSRDDQRILETIQAVAAEVLDTTKHVPTSAKQFAAEGDKEGDQHDRGAVKNVDPSSMVKSLREINEGSLGSSAGYGHFGVTRLSGIIALLFEQDDVKDVDLTREAWTVPDLDGPDSVLRDPPRQSESGTSKPRARDEVASAVRADLIWFLDELGKADFAARTTPQQMVQAIAFPLLVCIRAMEAGWLQRPFLTWIATKVAEIMFDRRYGLSEPRGLVANVRKRYDASGALDEFSDSVGDGTLWITLLGALKINGDESLEAILPPIAALSSVYLSRELLVRSDAARLSRLLRRLGIQNAQEQVVEKVELVVNAFSELTSCLKAMWPTLASEQKSVRSIQPANALLWHHEWGWHVTDNIPAETCCPGYINIEIAIADHPEIGSAIDHVTETCRRKIQ